jgi:hypothetical protein
VAVALGLTLLPNSAAAVSLTLRTEVDPVPPGGMLIYTIRVNNDGSSGGTLIGCFNPPPDCVATRPLEFKCVRAFNEGSSCAVGNPPQPGKNLCLPNPTGICASGPNFGLPCDTPHLIPSTQCPPTEGVTGTGDIVVTLPVPQGTTFLSADSGGTSDALAVTWVVPPLEPCGVPETPQCPLLTARFTVADDLPVGWVIQNRASVTDPSGSQQSTIAKTTVGTFRLKQFTLAYPKRDQRDKFTYQTFFTLGPGVVIDPGSEPFRIRVDTATQSLIDLGVEAGGLGQTGTDTWKKNESAEPGLSTVVLHQLIATHYQLKLQGKKLTLPAPDDLQAMVTLSFGDTVLTHPVTLVVKQDGGKFEGVVTTTTTTTVSTTSTTPTTVTTSTTLPSGGGQGGSGQNPPNPTGPGPQGPGRNPGGPGSGPPEVCNNCTDDNGNGLSDLLDPACAPTRLELEDVVVRHPRNAPTTIKRITIRALLPDTALVDAGQSGNPFVAALAFDDGSQLCMPLDLVKAKKTGMTLRTDSGSDATVQLRKSRKGRVKVRYKQRGVVELDGAPPAIAFGLYGTGMSYKGVTALRAKGTGSLAAQSGSD